jgi:hypothetical protein
LNSTSRGVAIAFSLCGLATFVFICNPEADGEEHEAREGRKEETPSAGPVEELAITFPALAGDGLLCVFPVLPRSGFRLRPEGAASALWL